MAKEPRLLAFHAVLRGALSVLGEGAVVLQGRGEVLRALAPDAVVIEVECGEGAVVLQGRGSLQT